MCAESAVVGCAENALRVQNLQWFGVQSVHWLELNVAKSLGT